MSEKGEEDACAHPEEASLALCSFSWDAEAPGRAAA